MHKRTAVCVSLLSLMIGSPRAGAVTLEVCASGCPYTLIQRAIDDAVGGETILLHDGIYSENLDFKGKALTLTSVNGADETVIDGQNIGRVVKIHDSPDAVLEKITLRNGKASDSDGGAIQVWNSSVRIDQCVITGNSSIAWGGGLYYRHLGGSGKTVVISNSTFSNNTASEGAGIYLEPSGQDSILVSNCAISGNTGGGVAISSYTSDPRVTIADCTISGNVNNPYPGQIGAPGGGIYAHYAGTADITWLKISGCTISGNSVGESSGGGIYAASTYRLKTPWLEISDSLIRNNQAGGRGGGVAADEARISHCVISGNKVIGAGGGVGCLNSVLAGCRISGNTAGIGGGVYSDSSYAKATVMYNSVVSGNVARSGGGGIYIVYGTMKILHSTISGNATPREGGGIDVASGDPAQFVNSILWGNRAGRRGAEIHLHDGASVSARYSDIRGGWRGERNIDQDPLFLRPLPAAKIPVAGGDYHIRNASPCIDRGTPLASIKTDMDGDKRPLDRGYDIGADEHKRTR